MMDQTGITHCIECWKCDGMPADPVCGVDGVTYDNACRLQYATCTNGGNIRLAYRGTCKSEKERQCVCVEEEES